MELGNYVGFLLLTSLACLSNTSLLHAANFNIVFAEISQSEGFTNAYWIMSY
jgi:hypothetical protein